MTEIMRSMPLYKELMVKYTIHMEIVEKSLDIFRIKELPEIGELEQTLATGLDKKGSSIAGEKILQRVAVFLFLDCPSLPKSSFIRL